jgi:TatD DNase family protein
MIDTHAHFTKKYPYALSVVSEQLERAKRYGVKAIVSVMAEPEGYQSAYEAALNFPEIYLALGISRHLALKTTEKHWNLLASYLEKQNSKVVAIGETGLDYHFEPNAYEISKQKGIFIRQIGLAIKYHLPLVIHSGKSMDDVLDILENEYASAKGGVIHFFTGDLVQAQRAIKMGFYLSFALPILTNRKMQETCKEIPLQQILTETDSPFLKPPQGWPTRMSEPACVIEIVKKIAEIKEISFEEAAQATWENAVNLFGILN